MLLFACGSSTDDSESTEASYSKPPIASNQAMQSAAKSLGTTVSSSNASSSNLTGGTRVEIKLRDDKGSGSYAYSPAEFIFKVGEIPVKKHSKNSASDRFRSRRVFSVDSPNSASGRFGCRRIFPSTRRLGEFRFGEWSVCLLNIQEIQKCGNSIVSA